MKRLILFLILFSIVNTSTLFGQSKESVQLEPGKQVQNEMKADEIHKFRVRLESNQFLYGLVEQQGIDLIVKSSIQRGKRLTKLTAPPVIVVPKAFFWLAKTRVTTSSKFTPLIHWPSPAIII